MRSSRETHGFGLGASQRLRTPRTPICSIGAKRCQGPPGALGSPERSPIPCSGIAQGQLGVASFDLIRELGFFMDAGCCTQFQRLRQPGTGATAAVPSLFHRGRTFPVPKGTALHGSWITAMGIHMDPQFPLPLTPLPALWGLQGTPAPTSAHSPAWSSGKGGRMIPRKEWGEGGS